MFTGYLSFRGLPPPHLGWICETGNENCKSHQAVTRLTTIRPGCLGWKTREKLPGPARSRSDSESGSQEIEFPCWDLYFPDKEIEFPCWDLYFPDWEIEFPCWDLYFPDWEIEFPCWDLYFPDREIEFPDQDLSFPARNLSSRSDEPRIPGDRLEFTLEK